MSIKRKFQRIIKFLVESNNGDDPLTGTQAARLFNPDDSDETSKARNLIASFLILLSGPQALGFKDSRDYLRNMAGANQDTAAQFFLKVMEYIFLEIETAYRHDPDFRKSFDDLHDSIIRGFPLSDAAAAQNKIGEVFFPEGASETTSEDRIGLLREKRRVRISSLNSDPVRSPGREVLFTSNALLTVGSAFKRERKGVGAGTEQETRAIEGEEQIHWYDHPIPVGIEPERNELLHGIKNLSRALEFEERIGAKEPGRNIDLVLSVSVTHRSLHSIARTWIESELSNAGGTAGINLYVFTEADAVRLMEEILIPAAKRYFSGSDSGPLREIFGVDGEYGRHYSFLKAIARFWSVFISPEIRATFKIDLDQVFPQEELVARTGASAFQHLVTPLWGARGTDSSGNRVYMGMIAGSLVNKKDIASSLFAPDVVFPRQEILRSSVPQAVSTEAEMMARYGPGREFDGTGSCIQRVHVTGGTNGILVEALRRYRPFTPSCVGRAEDQAYLLSVIFKSGAEGYLRYVHAPGLVMRHDAEAFAGRKAGQGGTGKIIGDYIRTLLFSKYAQALPWPAGAVKDAVDPFTGCFISRIPVTIVCLRFALKAAQLFGSSEPEQGMDFFTEGVKRLSDMIELFTSRENFFHEIYEREKYGWDLYYDILDFLERKIDEGDSYAIQLGDTARDIIKSLRLKIDNLLE